MTRKRISSPGFPSPRPFLEAIDALEEEEDFPQDTELLLGTHLTVVVQARLVAAQSPVAIREIGLVIARQHCKGDRPLRRALQAAADRCTAQSIETPDRIEVRIGGRWVPITARSSGAPPSKGNTAMNINASSNARRFASAAACAGLLAAFGSPASADNGNKATSTYQKERAACLNGQTSQDRQTCLREAGAALQESRRGGLTNPSPEVLARNAAQRCKSQPLAERVDCERLARGEGEKEGSVAEGAIVREITTVQTEPTAAGN